MTTYAGDPHWITCRYPATCLKCGRGIPRHATAWYYPKRRYDRRARTYCEECGRPMAAEFTAAAEDEDFMLRQFARGY